MKWAVHIANGAFWVAAVVVCGAILAGAGTGHAAAGDGPSCKSCAPRVIPSQMISPRRYYWWDMPTAGNSKPAPPQPAMTQLVQRLERPDLVQRLSDSNHGRAALVTLAELGRALLAREAEKRRARLAELLLALSEEDERALWLSAQVALPILRQLLETATGRSFVTTDDTSDQWADRPTRT
jgi:hypothetical protein